jgi:hypothetical protein
MSFLFPAMLAGLLGMSVPIALHLIAKQKFPIRDFPTLRLLTRDIVWRTLSRRRESTGTAITGCLPRITSSGGPSRRWRSGTSARGNRPLPAGMEAVRMPQKAAATLRQSPARTTPHGLRGRN